MAAPAGEDGAGIFQCGVIQANTKDAWLDLACSRIAADFRRIAELVSHSFGHQLHDLLIRRRQRLVQLVSQPYKLPEPVAPTDEEIKELMTESMQAEFGYSAQVCSDATGGQVKPGIFCVVLNTAALEYARAIFAEWGTPANNISEENLDG
jgi:hypothetical protein